MPAPYFTVVPFDKLMMITTMQPWNAKLKELYASAMDKNLTEWVLERFEGVSYTPGVHLSSDTVRFFTI